MKSIKHTGKMKNTGSKVLVAFRTLPGESDKALVFRVDTLPDSYHDALMDMIETDQVQQAFELGEMLFIRSFPDGRPMLQALQADDRLKKVSTDEVYMTPNPTTQVLLSELNKMIAEQKNVAIDELYTFVKGAPQKAETPDKSVTTSESLPSDEPVAATPDAGEVLDDVALAKSYRSQADAMYKEAARLRREADDLDPPKKKATKKNTEEA
jgi:hypothetical protein